MRLIDAEAFYKAVEKEKRMLLKNGKTSDSSILIGGLQMVLEWINEQPTIEAKPVVCCKDCKYNVANSKHDPLDITDYTDITCEYFMTDGMLPNDYCSQGVKIPVLSMEDVSKMIEKELPSLEENPIFRTIREIEKENSND